MLQAMRAACLALAFFVLSAARAADTVVPPGLNTLASAVAGATPGDTLILQDGGYSGDVSIDKSLTIRASKRSTGAVVDLIMLVSGDSIDVTLQGLTFARNLVLHGGRSIRVLENTFVGNASITPDEFRTSEGDGVLYIVGNRLLNGSSIQAVRADNSYIAGNVLANGFILVEASVWVVGNDITYFGTSSFSSWSQTAALRLSGAGISVRVLGNRIVCKAGSGANYCHGIGINSVPQSLIAGNLIVVSGFSLGGGIVSDGSGLREIRNNTIDGTGSGDNSRGLWQASGNAASFVTANIVRNFGWAIILDASGPDVASNLCIGNARGQTCDRTGNIQVDPAFQDQVDFRLNPGSPAIDAGPTDFAYADLDRTRNDIGAYGGPWSIGQYDAQRDPSNFAPYVYPLFNAGFAGGELEVEALGVARLR